MSDPQETHHKTFAGETGQMSSVKTGCMPAVKTVQMYSAETKQVSTGQTGLCTVSLLHIWLVLAEGTCGVSTANICPISTVEISSLARASMCLVLTQC